MSGFRNGEFSTASHDVKGLKAAKEELYQLGFPEAETRAVVDRFFDPSKFSHMAELKGQKIVYVVAPSTSRENTLPRHIAERMRQNFGGEILVDWATPLAVERAAKKGALGKIREPARFKPNDAILAQVDPHATLVLVDDVVTTGQSLGGMQEALGLHGLKASQVVSLAQSELRRVSTADIDRLIGKLGTDIRPAIETVLGHYPLKHYANYIERITPHANDQTDTGIKLRQQIRSHFQAESQRVQRLGQTQPRSVQGVGISAQGIKGVQLGSGTATELHRGNLGETIGVRRGSDDAKNSNPFKAMNSPTYELIKDNNGRAQVVAKEGQESELVDNGKTFALSGFEQRDILDALLRHQERVGNVVPYSRDSIVQRVADRVQISELLGKPLSSQHLREIVNDAVSSLRLEIDRLPDYAVTKNANPMEAPNTQENEPKLKASGKLDEDHKAHLLSKLSALRKDFATSNLPVMRQSILTEADTVVKKIAKVEAGIGGSAPMKLRRSVRDFVEGRIDVAKLEANLASFRSAISDAVLSEKTHQSQAIKAK